jgi:hypothetical protein
MIKITIQNGEDVTELETDYYFMITNNELGVKATTFASIPWINRLFKYDLFCKMRDDHIDGMVAQSDIESNEQPGVAAAEGGTS